MTSKISLVIITKDRPADLAHCYESLNKLTVYPDEFILIDSSTNSKSRLLTKQLAIRLPCPVRYIHEPKRGFPVARNRGLRAAKYNWVAFTDDDCIVDKNFVRKMKQALKKHPHAVAIAGKSLSHNNRNLISHTISINENFWKSTVRVGDNIKDLETLDNKNVVYNISFLKKHNISYDESRTLFDGASDDCDLGMQIQRVGGLAYYEKNMIVYHKNLTDIFSYTKHLLQRSSAHKTYENKWRSYRVSAGLSHAGDKLLWPYFKKYIYSNKISFPAAVALSGLLLYTFILVRVVKN